VEPERIVSLLSSGTELVCALGLGDRLVGRSHECDHPAWVTLLPPVSQPTFDVTGSSRDIDDQVRQRLRAGTPLYEIDEARLASLAPDIVITQTHCEVCAVSPHDLAHGGSARLVREQVVALRTGTLDGILEGFLEVARVLGRPAEGDALVAHLRAQISELAARTSGLPRHRIACLEWIDPVFAMGNWGPELVEIAGGDNLLGSPGEHSTTTPWEAVLDANPDVLVVAPCGFGIERTVKEMPVFANRPGWETLSAVRRGNVFVAEGSLYFNRSGPSVFESARILAEILHPSVFPPTHEHTAWQRWSS
jgi:iron complex transport system substrate-binding protein